MVFVGIAMVFYPWLSEYVYENRVDSIVNAYKEEAANIDTSEKDALLRGAAEYNDQLVNSNVALVDPWLHLFNHELKVLVAKGLEIFRKHSCRYIVANH